MRDGIETINLLVISMGKHRLISIYSRNLNVHAFRQQPNVNSLADNGYNDPSATRLVYVSTGYDRIYDRHKRLPGMLGTCNFRECS